jgi:CelD/BcsL family acetyltransferase involved in cellulose biosynthesis
MPSACIPAAELFVQSQHSERPLNLIDPLTDSRWDDLVSRHPAASAFHLRGWLAALKDTYGYQPFAVTSAEPGEPLEDGLVACRIRSWLTGTRIVSLPFTDHCDMLVSDAASEQRLLDRMIEEGQRERCSYLELRPLSAPASLESGFQPSETFCFHELDLAPGLDELHKGLHKDSIRRKIRRAEESHLSYETGCGDEFVEAFYHLLLITRRRHHLPPQPKSWFRNLVKRMGDAVRIRLARKDGAAIAAILTLRHRSKVIYKYGCSDGAFHQLGGMPFLFWKLIEESKNSGADSIDFGRSEIENEGLIAFKSKFGAAKRTLTYFRYPQVSKQNAGDWGDSRLARRVFSILPDGVLSAAGKVLYKHIG